MSQITKDSVGRYIAYVPASIEGREEFIEGILNSIADSIFVEYDVEDIKIMVLNEVATLQFLTVAVQLTLDAMNAALPPESQHDRVDGPAINDIATTVMAERLAPQSV